MFINARVLIAVVTTVAAAAIVPSTAGAWAPAATATVHPGVQTFTAGGQCTANFIYTAGGNTYIGQAAHCASTGAATDTDGCLAASLPLGTAVEITGASRPGTLAYSSWLTMQANGESNPDVCAYTVTPGIPGDSGSGFLNASGQAIGTLSTVALAPLAGSNGVADLGREVGYARANGSLSDLRS